MCNFQNKDIKNKELHLSTLNKTWIFDLDGTLLLHNGYKMNGMDTLLDGVKDFISEIPKDDKIIILTARTKEYENSTLEFLNENSIRYDEIIFDMPMGERVLINDRKPSGLDMSISINLDRNNFNMPIIYNDK